MIDYKEVSLRKALEASACRSLPKAFTENGVDFWLKGIALVRKRDGSYSYCLVERRHDGMVVYKEDYGSMSPIYGLISVHPYVMLDRSSYEYRGSDDTLRKKLSGGQYLSHEDVAALTSEELAQWRIRLAIEAQKNADERYMETGEAPDINTEMDEDGFTEISSDPNIVAKEDEFADIAGVGKAKRGRKPKK